LNIGKTCRLIEEIGKNEIDLTFNTYTPYIKDELDSKLDDYLKTFVNKSRNF
jgi:hypothetical protein